MVEKWLETGYVGWKKRKESRLELRDDARTVHARVRQKNLPSLVLRFKPMTSALFSHVLTS